MAGNNLHIWITMVLPLPTDFVVDAAQDGAANATYGCAFADQFGLSTQPGTCPILGLSAAPAVTTPMALSAHGEPWVGGTFAVHLANAPGNTLMFFAFGTWAPSGGNTCNAHVTVSGSEFQFTDPSGRARLAVPVPANPSLVHMEVGYQAALGLQGPFSNALRVTVGGAR